MPSSRLPGFYNLSWDERLKIVKDFANLTDEEISLLKNTSGLDFDIANRMIENVISVFELPLGIATNFLINGKEYLIPMAIEEPSVVAAASHAAKIARAKGGFFSSASEPLMIGQIQLVNVSDPYAAKNRILQHRDEIIKIANEQDPILVSVGGGCRDVTVRVIDTRRGPMVIVHIIVDVRDAMGANAVNTMCEKLAPYIEEWGKGKVYLRILSNLATYRIARCWAVFDRELVGGDDVVEGIISAYEFAESDPYRAATHNKGIMNGIDAVVIATGNDWRAVEAGAHAFAALGGHYSSLTKWERNSDGDLVGSIEIPIAVGVVGGATKTHPKAQLSRKILNVKSARELAEVLAAVGLAQNFAALRALASEGIQRGHMELHARNIAIMAGARGNEIDYVANEMIKMKIIRVDKAKEILEKLRGDKNEKKS